MPKRKNKRKKSSKKRIFDQNQSVSKEKRSVPLPRDLKILSLFSRNDAQLTYSIVFAAPLFLGAIVSKGSVFIDPTTFIFFLVLLIISRFWFKLYSEFKSVSKFITYCAFLCLHMSVFAVLGVYSQHPKFALATAVLGLVPAFLLSAALVAKHASKFEEAGYKRSYQHTSKKGNTSERPGGVTRFFTAFLMLLPGLVLVAGVFSVLPVYFLFVAVVLIRTPILAQAFQEKNLDDDVIYQRVMRLALFATVLMLVAGIFSRG